MQPGDTKRTEVAGSRPATSLEPNGTCGRCGAALAWVKTCRGKSLPLEPSPSEDSLEGNFTLDDDGVAHYIRDSARMAAFTPDGTRSAFPIYIAHFATCTGG